MSDPNRERPCIHIALAAGADSALVRALVRALEVGAEEEGVPCRLMPSSEPSGAAAAYEAAFSSRFGIGLGLDRGEIVLHEMHMPAAQPVLRFDLSARAGAACRAMGANAARLLVGRPLHLSPLPEATADAVVPIVNTTIAAPRSAAPSAPAGEADLDSADLARLVATVVERLRERGIR